MAKILVIDDESALCDAMTAALRFEGFEVIGAPDGQVGLSRALSEAPDLIITDILMPRLDGMTLVAQLKARPQTRLIPIILVTAVDQRAELRRLMELGADDYLIKPFTLDELIKAAQAQLRKQQWRNEARGESRPHEQGAARPADDSPACFLFHARSFRPGLREVVLPDARAVELSVNEARLLAYLLANADRPLDRPELFEGLGRVETSPFDRSIDVLVSQLRHKLDDHPRAPTIIRTVRSIGYLLAGPVAIQHGDGKPPGDRRVRALSHEMLRLRSLARQLRRQISRD